MPKRVGITTRPEDRHRLLELELKEVVGFMVRGPFGSRREAREWQDGHPHDWERDPEDGEHHGPFARWWGYELEHAGPSSSAVHRAVDEVVKKWS
jgi:hypothetical protein